MTVEATASTEADAAAVGPVTRLDIAAPTGANLEAPLPCDTVDTAAPSEADVEQEVRFVTAAAAAPTGPDAGSEIARGGRRVVETPALGPTSWGLEGGGATPALRPDPVAPGEPDSGSQLLFTMAAAAAPTGPDAAASGPAAPTGPDAPEVVTAGSACGTVPAEPKDQRQFGGLDDPPEVGVQALLAGPVGGGGDDQGPVGAGPRGEPHQADGRGGRARPGPGPDPGAVGRPLDLGPDLVCQ
jgi:hypothetical protein